MKELEGKILELNRLIGGVASLDTCISKVKNSDDAVFSINKTKKMLLLEAMFLIDEIKKMVENCNNSISAVDEVKNDVKLQKEENIIPAHQEEDKNISLTQENEVVEEETSSNDMQIEQNDLKEEVIPEEVREAETEETIEEIVQKEVIEEKVVVEVDDKKETPVRESLEEDKKQMDLFKIVKTQTAKRNDNIPVTEIKKSLSIADRFRFQRELFGGNGEKMSQELTNLDNMTSLSEAMSYIENNLKWDTSNPVAKDFISILERKQFL